MKITERKFVSPACRSPLTCNVPATKYVGALLGHQHTSSRNGVEREHDVMDRLFQSVLVGIAQLIASQLLGRLLPKRDRDQL
jgi:hypothetical protein